MTDLTIRPVNGEDLAFIYATWLRSYRNDSLIGLSTKKSIFYENYQRILDHILMKDSTKVFIACKPDDPSVIFGYIIAEPSKAILHYSFTKDAFRRYGVARALFNTAFPHKSKSAVSITHKTKSTIHMTSEFVYNPFLLFIPD